MGRLLVCRLMISLSIMKILQYLKRHMCVEYMSFFQTWVCTFLWKHCLRLTVSRRVRVSRKICLTSYQSLQLKIVLKSTPSSEATHLLSKDTLVVEDFQLQLVSSVRDS